MSTAPGGFKNEEDLDKAFLESPEVKETVAKTEPETTKEEETTTETPPETTPTTTKEEVKTETPKVVDDELLAILNAGDETSEEQTVESVFGVIDKLKALAAEKKWDAPELHQVIGFKDTLIDIAHELDTKDMQLKEAVENFKADTAQLQIEFREFLAPLGLTAQVFKGRNWPAVLLEAAKRTFGGTTTPEKTGLEPEDDDDVPMTKGEWKKREAQRLKAAPTTTPSQVNPPQSGATDTEFQKWQRSKANEELQTTATSLSSHWINKNPLLAFLAKKNPEYAKTVTAKIQGRIAGSDLAVLIGKDKAGLGIKKVVDEYAAEVKAAFAAAGINPNAPKKGVPVPTSGGKPSTGEIKDFKKIPTHKEVDGKQIRLTADEQEEALDREFATVLGLKGA